MRKSLHLLSFTVAATLLIILTSTLTNSGLKLKHSNILLDGLKRILPQTDLANAELRILPYPHIYFNRLRLYDGIVAQEVRIVPGLFQGYNIQINEIQVRKRSSQTQDQDYTTLFREIRKYLLLSSEAISKSQGILKSLAVKELTNDKKTVASSVILELQRERADVNFEYNFEGLIMQTEYSYFYPAPGKEAVTEIYVSTDPFKGSGLGSSLLSASVKSIDNYDSIFVCVDFKAYELRKNIEDQFDFNLPERHYPYFNSCLEFTEYEIVPKDSLVQFDNKVHYFSIYVDTQNMEIIYKPQKEIVLELLPEDDYFTLHSDSPTAQAYSKVTEFLISFESLRIQPKSSQLVFSIAGSSNPGSTVNGEALKPAFIQSKVVLANDISFKNLQLNVNNHSATAEHIRLKNVNSNGLTVQGFLSMSIHPAALFKGSTGTLDGYADINCTYSRVLSCDPMKISLYSEELEIKSADISNFYKTVSPDLTSLWENNQRSERTSFSKVLIEMIMTGSNLKVSTGEAKSERGDVRLSGNYQVDKRTGVLQLRVLPFVDNKWYSSLPVVTTIFRTAIKAALELGVILKIEDNSFTIDKISIGSALNELNEAIINR